jgi:TrmH family RNA methyltransferase
MAFLKPSQMQLKLWAGLNEAKARRKERLFLAEGAKVVEDLLRSAWATKALLILSGREERFAPMIAEVAGRIDVYRLDERQWHRLSQDKGPEGIMAVASPAAMPSVDNLQAWVGDRLLLLHEINNPNNLGAILRTADWFGFRTILLDAGSVDYTHPKVVRTAMGCLFHLNLIADLDFVRVLPGLRTSFRLVGSDVRSGIAPHPCTGKTALLLGSESHGLPRRLLDLADEHWCIEGMGEAESLSLPQAAAVMMYACTMR